MKSLTMIALASKMNGLYNSNMDVQSQVHADYVLLPVFKTKTINYVMHYHFIPLASNWHFKLAHLFIPRMHDMTKLYLSISNGNNVICDICHFAKAIKVPYNFIFSHSKVNFELLHFDICGSTSTQYFHRYKYNLTTLYYFIIFKRIILSKYKDEISTHFQSFTQLIENQYNVVPKL